MVRLSLDPRTARTRHPHSIALDRAVQVAAAVVLLNEGMEVVEQVSIPLIAYTATLLGRPHVVNAPQRVGDQYR